MASGRLGFAKLTPSRAVLLYSNASANPASVSIQATTLSSTVNTNIALSIDTATVALNNITLNTALSAGSMTQRTRWLDPLSGTNVLRVNRYNPTNESASLNFPIQYWDGSAWTTGATSNLYGAKNWQKIDPYFLYAPSAYGGKTKASIVLGLSYNTSVDNMRFRHYEDLRTFTGAQFRLSQMFQDPGVTQTYSRDEGYGGFGFAVDTYTDYVMTFGNAGYGNVFNGKIGTPATGYTSNSIFYYAFVMQNSYGNIDQYRHSWYAPRLMAANGLFLIQGSGFGASGGSQSNFFISDVDLAVSEGAIGRSILWSTTANVSWWQISPSFSITSGVYGHVQWFDYNPNTDRYYFCMAQEGGVAADQNRNIYSFTRTGLRAIALRGYSGSSALTESMFTNHGRGPWGTQFVERPQRIAASLWWTCAADDVAYVSTDLANWQTAISYFTAAGEAANTFNKNQLTLSSYLYAVNGTANVSKFDSNFSTVADTAVLEYNTSVNNYQRTGIVLSPGDKLYAQNYGDVAVSVTAMGYED